MSRKKTRVRPKPPQNYGEARVRAQKAKVTGMTDFIVPNHILERRTAMLLSQSDLAKMIGVTKSTISMWENGIKGVKDKHKIELCRILKRDITELFDWRI